MTEDDHDKDNGGEEKIKERKKNSFYSKVSFRS